MALSNKIRVVLLASEWRTKRDELSTFNRELAIQLAKHPDLQVSVFLPRCDRDEKNDALSHNVTLVQATRRPGYDDETQWLCSPPKDLQIDIVIGHGVELGCHAPVIRESHNCKWVQFVHTDPEEREMFKDCSDAISEGAKEKDQDEVELCVSTDFVVAVGSKVAEAYQSYCRFWEKDQNIFVLTPGIFSDFSDIPQSNQVGSKFQVLVCGDGGAENAYLKGFDIAAKAVAQLNDVNLIFDAKRQDEGADRLNECSIPSSLLRIPKSEFREHWKQQLSEVDLTIMPSRTKDFGFTALEAMSAGLPVLVSANSGIGDALKKVPFGSHCLIDSEDPDVWARVIDQVLAKERELRLCESEVLRNSYARKYNWEEQCRDLVEKMRDILYEEPVVEQQPDAVLPLYLDCSVMKQPQTGEERIVSRKCGEAAESLSTQRSGKRKPHLGSTLDQGASSSKRESPSISVTIPNLDTLVSRVADAEGLSNDQRKTFSEILTLQTKAYVKSHDFSSSELERVGGLIKQMEAAYNVSIDRVETD